MRSMLPYLPYNSMYTQHASLPAYTTLCTPSMPPYVHTRPMYTGGMLGMVHPMYLGRLCWV